LGDTLFYQREETLAEEEAKKPKQHTHVTEKNMERQKEFE